MSVRYSENEVTRVDVAFAAVGAVAGTLDGQVAYHSTITDASREEHRLGQLHHERAGARDLEHQLLSQPHLSMLAGPAIKHATRQDIDALQARIIYADNDLPSPDIGKMPEATLMGGLGILGVLALGGGSYFTRKAVRMGQRYWVRRRTLAKPFNPVLAPEEIKELENWRVHDSDAPGAEA